MSVGPETRIGIWDLVPDGLFVIDADGVVVDANDHAKALVGGDPSGQPVEMLLPEQLRTGHVALRDQFRADPVRRAMGAGRRLPMRRFDGGTIQTSIALSPLPGGAVLVAVRDLSNLVQSEHRLVDATRRRILAEDHERIARDLHDTIIQSLFALGMNLQASLPGISEPALHDRVSGAVDTLDDIIRSIREVIFDIRRNRPDEQSLRGRVAEVTAELIPSLGFEPTLLFRGSLDDVADHHHGDVVAVVRESLSNVARHAEATQAAVEVAVEGGDVVIRVADNGVGVPETPVRHSGHANLAERARAAGGSFEVGAANGNGALVEWRAPLAG